MSTKMKGLLKGLRYISQIFESTDKEQDMQIGFPTDVKHVAHIGWDGPSVSSPSWMNEFRETPDFSSAPLNHGPHGDPKMSPRTRWASEDLNRKAEIRDSPVRDSPVRGSPVRSSPGRDKLPKPSRHRPVSGVSSSFDGTNQENGDVPKQSRRRQLTTVSANSPTREISEGTKPTRRQSNLTPEVDSTTQDLPTMPKQSRRRKSKGSSGGGSLRSKPRDYASPFSDPGTDSELISGSSPMINESCPASPLRDLQLEDKRGNGIS